MNNPYWTRNPIPVAEHSWNKPIYWLLTPNGLTTTHQEGEIPHKCLRSIQSIRNQNSIKRVERYA